MLDKKQVEGLEDFADLVITGYSRNNNVVTLTRADGTKFQFTTYGEDGAQGQKGPTGDTGNKGVSAYQAYVRDGRTTAANETAWINSLKGATGDAGSPGANGSKGANGSAGVTPTFSVGTVTELSPGSTPTASLIKSGNTYKINVGIPRGAAGTSGTNGTTPTLKLGTVSTLAPTATPTISISQSGTQYTINLGIPRGPKGANGTVGSITNGTNPTVNFSITMGSSTAVSKSVSGNTWTINLTVPTGAKGAKGATGNTGSTGSSTVTYAPITTSESTINNPGNNRFRGMLYNNRTTIFLGWQQTYHNTSIIKYLGYEQCVDAMYSSGAANTAVERHMADIRNGSKFWFYRCCFDNSSYFNGYGGIGALWWA